MHYCNSICAPRNKIAYSVTHYKVPSSHFFLLQVPECVHHSPSTAFFDGSSCYLEKFFYQRCEMDKMAVYDQTDSGKCRSSVTYLSFERCLEHVMVWFGLLGFMAYQTL